MKKKSPATRKAAPLKEAALSSFDGANNSTSRGWIYFPTLDTAKEIDTYTHWELVKRARWFFANSGFARRVVRGAGQMVGYLTPKALTSDTAWNDLAERNFENRAGSAQVFDMMGKHNFYSLQPKLISRMLLDGDLLLALTKTANDGAAVMPYEGHQIGNDGSTDAKIWQNGVRTNGLGRHIAYRLLSGDGHFDLAAPDSIYIADFERLNQVRGLTAFAHAINHLHDRTELHRDLKLISKISAQVRSSRTRPGAATKARGMGGARTRIQPDSSNPSKVDLEEVFRGGKVAELSDGEELKSLLDDRPHPNTLAFGDELVRDMAWGFGLSPEILWFVGKINGTANRYLLSDAVKWVEEKQQILVDNYCTRYWVYHLACEMKAGRLRACNDPDWFRVGWIPQPKLTVDRGRDGKLNIELYRSCMMTLKRHFAENFSEDWKPNVDDWVNELAYKRDKLAAANFTPSEVLTLLGSPQASSATAPDPTDPTAPSDPTDLPTPPQQTP